MKETIDKLMALLDIALDQAYSDGRQELNHRSDATDDAVTQLRTALEQAMAVKPVEAERKAAAEHHLEVMRKALAAKPVESQTPTKYQVLAITTAYEQGVGKGRQAHALKSEIADPYGACWNLDYAWKLGYEEGKQQAERMDAAKPGHYQFTNICCRVRFLLLEPRREVRPAWLARWRRFEQVKARWAMRKAEK